MVNQNRISYKELVMINDVIPNLSLSGLSKIEARFQVFIDAVAQNTHKADVTWQGILRSFLFHNEA